MSKKVLIQEVTEEDILDMIKSADNESDAKMPKGKYEDVMEEVRSLWDEEIEGMIQEIIDRNYDE